MDHAAESENFEIPDPNGPPLPVTEKNWATFSLMGMFKGLTVGMVAFGAIWSILSSCAVRCCGATRSAKLKWEEREAQIEAAIHDSTKNHDRNAG